LKIFFLLFEISLFQVNELEESLSGPKPLLERLNVKAEESLELEILEVNLDTRSLKVLSNEF
jgi:hypothetical protein